MEFLIVILILLINSVLLTILFKKKIEEVIPISVVGLVLIIYIIGLFDNLILGVKIIEIITILQVFAILLFLLKHKNKDDIRETLSRILTPGLCIYFILIGISILVNKNRIFEDLDEFNHWAVIIKNMFLYNSFGTNAESIVIFNEYPPFTAIFQYIFLAISKIYREDTIIIAHNILYFSFVIPFAKSITWKNILKTIEFVFAVIFLPMIFCNNFFVNILVDGLLGVVFAYIILAMFNETENYKFKWLKILVGEIVLCLTKTTGIFLAILSLLIIFIRLILLKKQDKVKITKEFKFLFSIILILFVLLLSWKIKVNDSAQRWDFKQLLKINKSEEVSLITGNFIKNIFYEPNITEKGFTTFSVILMFISCYFWGKNKFQNEKYKYYTISMLFSIFLYLIGTLIIYITVYDFYEAAALSSYTRYMSTIFLSFALFQTFILIENSDNSVKNIFIITSLIVLLMPLKHIQTQYINGENYINRSNTIRNNYTKIKRYKDKFDKSDKILYISGTNVIQDYITVMNNYELMPITITKMIPGVFSTEKDFIDSVKGYDYLYIYQINEEEIEKIKNVFRDKYVFENTLYRVENQNDEIVLIRERN